MTNVLRWVDPDDYTSVLLDMNGAGDWTTAGFAAMGDPDFGWTNLSVTLLSQQGVDGAVVASVSATTTVLSLPIAVRGTTNVSVDQVLGLWRKLALRVAAGGIIEVQLAGETEPRYFEAIPSGISNLIAGQKDAVLQYAGAAQGFLPNLAIMLQPNARLAQRLASVQKLTNASLLMDANLDGRPDGIAYSATTHITAESISDAERAYAVTRAGVTSIDMRFPTSAAVSGDLRAFSVYASANVAAVARITPGIEWLDGGGAVLSTTLGTQATLGPIDDPDDRARYTVTGTAPATTANARPLLRMANLNLSAVITYVAQAQLETGSIATGWRLGTETRGTAVGVCSMLLHNPGNVPALLRVSVDPVQSTASVVQLRAHLRSFNRPKGKTSAIAEWFNKFSQGFELESAVLSTGTASVAVGAASGGNVAETTFTAPPVIDQGQLVQCWQKALAPADVKALEGAFYVCAVLSTTTAGAKYRVQARVTGSGLGVGTAGATTSLEPIVYDTTSVAAGDLTQYSFGLLGVVQCDPDRGDTGLTLQGWASLETPGAGASKLRWDALFLLPADELSALYTEPSFLPGGSTTDEWGGFQLVTPTAPAGLIAGTVVGQQIVLGAINKAGGTPPVAGFKPVAGTHTVTVDARLFTGDLVERTLSQLVAYNITTAAVIKSRNLVSKPGSRWSLPNKGNSVQFTVPGDAATTDSIEYYVAETAATAGQRQTNVLKISHSVVLGSSGGSNAAIVIDADARSAYVTGSNPIAAPQGFIYAQPGFSVLTLMPLDVSKMGFDSVYIGQLGPEVMAQFIAARTTTCKVDGVPRVRPL